MNGTIVTPSGVGRADLHCEDGKIVAVGTDGPQGELMIDASDLLLLPGGVDSHVHLMDPGDTTREDFPTGTAAAAARGVTTVIEHTHLRPIRNVSDLEEKLSHLGGRSHVDYALAAHALPGHTEDLLPLWLAGIAFFKAFTCSTHGLPGLDSAVLWEVLQRVAGFDGSLLIHAEDDALTADAERRLKAAGRMDGGILYEWRSREAELVALAATVTLVGLAGARATLAHVSTPTAAGIVAAARDEADVAAEACPQYFVLHESEVEELDGLRKFTPPARIRSRNEEIDMWDALARGMFSHVSTDHAPSTLDQKQSGDIWEVQFGLPGIDTTYPFLIDAALAGRLALSDVAELYSLAPARRYGLHAKGSLEPGKDADFVLVDPAGSWTVGNEDIISKAGWSPFAGRTLQGRVVATYLRGVEVARDGADANLQMGRFVAGPGHNAE